MDWVLRYARLTEEFVLVASLVVKIAVLMWLTPASPTVGLTIASAARLYR